MEYDKSTLEKLILVEKKSYLSIGKLYGVSGNAIKKAAIKLGIDIPKRRKINPCENFSHKLLGKNSKIHEIDNEKFIEIIKNSLTWKEIGIKLGYSGKLSANTRLLIKQKCNELNISFHERFYELFKVKDITKKELFESRKNWQSARTYIQKLARQTFYQHNKKPKCFVCGYDKHIEVAHIKPVANFDDSTTIDQINSIDNLIGLCPNHHWEFDNGLLEIEK